MTCTMEGKGEPTPVRVNSDTAAICTESCGKKADAAGVDVWPLIQRESKDWK